MKNFHGYKEALVLVLLVMSLFGCKEQSVRLDQEYKNKLDEVVLFVKYPKHLRMLGVGSNSAAMAASGGFIGGLIGGVIDASRVSHIAGVSRAIQQIISEEQYVKLFEKNIVETVQDSLNVKVVGIGEAGFYDYEELLTELEMKGVSSVMYVGLDLAMAPGMSSIDMNLDVKMLAEFSEGRGAKTIHVGSYYFKTLPALSVGIDAAKDSLNSAMEAWKNDNREESDTPYPNEQLRALELENAKYWVSGDGEKLRGAITEAMLDFVRMLRIDFSTSPVRGSDGEIAVFYRDYRGVLSGDERMNNVLNGALVDQDENKKIIRGPYGYLFSVKAGMEKMKEAYYYDSYFVRM